MTEGEVGIILKEALNLVLMCSAPMLLVALGVGLIVAVFQATTQIQEATLAFGVKILAVLGTFLIFGPWMLNKLMVFTNNLLLNVNTYIR